MNKVAVVILNWNGKRFLEKFLPSVIKYSQTAAIYIADNASKDDSLDFIQKNFPEVKTIAFSSNLGFCKGYNEALEQIDAEYYVLLNSDVEVTPGWIEPIIDLMDADKEIAACQPKIKSFTERNKFEYAGAAGGYIDKFGYPFCRGRIFNKTENDFGQYDDIEEVFWASGACMFVRSEYYKAVNGLDEDFFAHMEEIDLCWRLKNQGYRIMYCGLSEIYHVGGGTLDKLSPRKTYLNFRNNLILLLKNVNYTNLAFLLFIRLILDGIAALKFLFTDSYRHSLAILKAHFSFYLYLFKLLAKRRVVEKKFKKERYNELYNGSLVFDHFIRGIDSYKDLNFKNPK
jgi:GT2 family glycosyltransferase